MQQLLNFFFKNRHSLLFLVLFVISTFLTIRSHDYHKSQFLSSSNQISGSIHALFSNIGDYFDLKEQNAILVEENNRLKSLELNYFHPNDTTQNNEVQYHIIPAKVVKNSYKSPQNYLTLNKGSNDKIKEEFGVITSKGIVGIIDKTSAKYARVVSVLNSKSKINAMLKKSHHFGTLEWNGEHSRIVQLNDIQDLVNFSVGDTVVTSGYSMIFPENIPIGTVASYQLNNTKDLYVIDVELFNDMSNLKHVYVIENLDSQELESLNPSYD